MVHLFLAVFLLCAGAVTAAAQDIPWNQITDAAKNGGVVSVYHNVPPPGGDKWLAVFHDAFPNVQVEATRLGSGELQHRFSTESANGVNQADVVMTSWDDSVASWLANGWVRIWTPPESSALPAGSAYKGAVYTITGGRAAILSNKNKVRDSEAPQEWKDVFDPKWKGAIGMDPPWRSVIVQASIALWEEQGIKDTARRMKELDVRFFNGGAGILQAIIRGDVKVAPTIEGPAISAVADGAPVRITFPKSGVPTVPGIILIPTKAAHPELGMLFANWAMTMEGQQSYQDHAGAPPVRTGLTPPRYVPPNDQVNLISSVKLLNPERQKAITEEYRDVFGVK